MSTEEREKKPRHTKLKRTSKRFGEIDPAAPHVRKKRMEIRFHNHEFLLLVDALTRSGQYQNLAQFVRENILDVAQSNKISRTRSEVIASFSEVQNELRKIGVNINQIAKRVNQGDENNLTRDLKTVLAQISECSVRLLKKSNGVKE